MQPLCTLMVACMFISFTTTAQTTIIQPVPSYPTSVYIHFNISPSLDLQSGLFHSDFPAKILHKFLVSQYAPNAPLILPYQIYSCEYYKIIT